MTDFPTSLDGVTADWLTQVLQASGALGGGTVRAFSPEPIGVGVGLMGLLYRLSLDYDGAPGPATAVLKVPVPHEGTRHVARTFRFYEKEVGFYRHLAARSPFGTAPCFAAEHDSDSDDFVILLGDITDGAMYNQIEGCPPEVAHVGTRALARHHGAFADSELFDQPEMAWLPFTHDPPTPQGVMQGVTDSREPFQAKFPELAGPEIDDLVSTYVPSVPDLLTVRPGRPVTLVHGDYRLDNLFFGAGDAVTVIDWQICGKGNMAYDLAYFITQSLTIEDRRAHEPALIDAYLDELRAAGVEHDRDDFMEDYRAAVMFCLCYPIQAGGQIELANDRARTLVGDMFGRAMAAIADHDATDFLGR